MYQNVLKYIHIYQNAIRKVRINSQVVLLVKHKSFLAFLTKEGLLTNAIDVSALALLLSLGLGLNLGRGFGSGCFSSSITICLRTFLGGSWEYTKKLLLGVAIALLGEWVYNRGIWTKLKVVQLSSPIFYGQNTFKQKLFRGIACSISSPLDQKM